jgi:hypothetical protein
VYIPEELLYRYGIAVFLQRSQKKLDPFRGCHRQQEACLLPGRWLAVRYLPPPLSMEGIISGTPAASGSFNSCKKLSGG